MQYNILKTKHQTSLWIINDVTNDAHTVTGFETEHNQCRHRSMSVYQYILELHGNKQ